MPLNTQAKKIIYTAFKIAVIALSYYYIFHRLKAHQSYAELHIRTLYVPYIVIAGLLMPVNWLIESGKWKYLLSAIQHISLPHALKSVLSGVTLGIFTPNRIGELAGRTFILEKKHRIPSVYAAAAGSLAQTTVTFLLGLPAVILLYLNHTSSQLSANYPGATLIVLTSVSFFVLLLYFRLDVVVSIAQNTKCLKTRLKHIDVLNSYSSVKLIKLLGYSTVRYAVFLFQYYLLLIFFNVDIGLTEALIAAAAAFFINTVIPSIVLADVGIRGSTALLFFGLYSDNNPGILWAAFALWLINLVIPALLGSFIFFKTKL